ncbi:MAG TPA: hypothetical protein VMG60_20020 [Burkholderiaceae bacterium]|nr:hypothetical protein [Burkholderiaceae bacterium]
MKRLATGTSALLASLLAACASGGGSSQPYAIIQAQPIQLTETVAPAFVMAIDGLNRALRNDLPVSPGTRKVDVSIQTPGGGEPPRDTLTIDAKPCMRYLLAAQRSSATSRDWHAFVAQELPIEDCVKQFPAAK